MTERTRPRDLSAGRRELLRRRLAGRSPDRPRLPAAGSVPRGERPRLSFTQERLWFLDQLMPGTIAYNAPAAYRLRGPLDHGVLERAVETVVARHEVLRTRYGVVDGEPYQVVDEAGGFVLEVVDLSGSADGVGEARRLVRSEGETPFDLASGPLFRARLVRLGVDDHVLLLTFHHSVFDGSSIEVFHRDLSTAYATLSLGETPPGGVPELEDLPVQYADFAAWQREWLSGEVLERQIDYWRDRLEGAPPALELPADRPRPPLPSFRGGVVDFVIPPDVVEGLRRLAQERGATLFMVMLAAYQALLARYTRSTDIVVAAPAAGRPRLELEKLIGFFVNTLPLRTDVGGDPTFGELVDRVREGALEAFAHQDVPFERVVEELAPPRDLSRNPVIQMWFDLFTVGGGFRLGDGAVAERFDPGVITTRFDMELLMEDAGEEIGARLVYATDLFDVETMERFAGHLVGLLSRVAADPGVVVSRVEVMPEDERRRVLEEWSGASVPAPVPVVGSVSEWFERQVAATPDAVAVVCGEERLSFAELNARANRLAWWLRGRGVGADDVVGVCLRRGVDLPVAVLAVVKAGGAYLPLDASYPVDRLAGMLADAGAVMVLGEEAVRDRLPAGVPAFVLDADRDAVADCPDADPPQLAGPEDLLYVYFTSGSTGRPKGVAVPHRVLLNVLGWHRRLYAERPVALAYFPFTSDASFYEMATAWVAGGAVVLADEEDQVDPARLAALLDRHRVTKVIMPNVALDQLLEHACQDPAEPGAPVPLASLREVVATGDRLKVGPAARAVFRRLEGVVLDNHYGPTEAHAVTAARLTGDPRAWPAVPSIGRPVAYARVHLLDEAMNPVPPGVPGELYAGGGGVARGYAGRPDLTAERFVPDPFSAEPGRRLYRTGDLARWRPDGTLEFLGRIDHQVKIRGYRIEPGEIETVLRAHPAVREAVAVPAETPGGEPSITAYVIPAGAPAGDAELRAHLRGRLPDYMIPSTFVTLSSFPLTVTGKVDRNRLPAPGSEAGGFAAPRTREERAVAEVWADVLGRDRVGRTDDFFALGGHSLLATRVNARLREAFGADLPLRALFENRTVADLARVLREAAPSAAVPLRSARRGERPRLSFGQQRLWFLDQLMPGNLAYNMTGAYRFRGSLDAATLERALDAVVARHEVLRTRYGVVDGEPYQVVDEAGGFVLEVVDLSGSADGVGEARRLVRSEGETPFDLASGPLFRARLVRLGVDDHVLLLTFHHSVFDGSSIEVFHRDLSTAYATLSLGETPPGGVPELEDLPVQYADFAAWQREWLSGEVLERQIDYWRDRLEGAPPALELPADRPRPPLPSFRGGVVDFVIPPDVVEGLRRLAQERGATLFMVMLAAYQALLARYTRSTDIVVAAPAAGRPRLELEKLIGFFVNTLPLRTDVGGDPTFGELVDRVREGALEAFAHQDVPFERVVEELAPPRDLSRNPVIQMWFDLFTVGGGFRLGDGAVAERFDPGVITTRFDMELLMEDAGEEIGARLVYATDLFDVETMERFAGHLVGLLSRVAADPGVVVSRVEVMPEDERRRVLEEWSGASVPAPVPVVGSVSEWFERQVAATPDAVAVVCGEERLSFAELNARANRLAWWLRGRGVGADDVVGVCLRRGVDLPVAVLAVVKAGGAYLPLDASYPVDRLAGMLADAGAVMVLGEEAVRDRLPAGVPAFVLDADRDAVADCPDADPPQLAGPEDLLYVYFTSGSTGRPKGVALPHRALLNVFAWQLQRSPDPVPTLQYAPANFDISFQETFDTWLAGGPLVLVDEDTRADPERLTAMMGEAGVRRLHCPPMVLDQLAQAVAAGAPEPPLTEVITAGEELQLTPEIRELLERRARAGAPITIDNQYGPTEAHIVTAARLDGDPAEWPDLPSIGSPVPGTAVHLLDESFRPVPTGVPGELCAAGPQLAYGYLGRPELTADRFVPDPFSAEPGRRLYRTGDLARRRPDGTLEFLGRIDHQVKIRGYRIEPGEIEAALTAHPLVEEAVVIPVRAGGDRRLAAYLVPAAGADPRPADLRVRLKRSLPEYMIPAHFVNVPAIPLTGNGKLDRAALPDPFEAGAPAARTAPRTGTERLVHDLWAGLLGGEEIGVDQDFFDLGGHSLLATRIITRIRRDHGVELPLRALFEHRTIEDLARVIDAARAQGTPGAHDPAGALGHGPGEPGPDAHPMLTARLDEDLTFGGGNGHAPAAGPAPAHVLLTGATGFLGAHLLRELLDRSAATVTCLVRAGGEVQARERILARLRDAGRWDGSHGERVRCLAGDLSAPDLGLDAVAYRRLAAEVGAIYHCGAEVSALKTYDQLEPVNVGGVRGLLRLASRGDGVRFHFVSTVSVAPLAADGTGWAERWPDGGREIADSPDVVRASNGYVQTKWVAERLVAEARARGLAASIYRPARVTGDSRGGPAGQGASGVRDGADDALAHFVRGCVEAGVAPAEDMTDLWTPVDQAAAMIVALSLRPGTAGRVFNLPADQVRLSAVWDHLAAAGHRLRRVDYEEWRRAVRAAGPANPAFWIAEVPVRQAGAATEEGRGRVIGRGLPVHWDGAARAAAPAGLDAPRVPGALIRRYIDDLMARALTS
ncbi:hypothetical protein GCM10023085_49310 [Actinomadura viridis]|uniref:non-ribosomal peptide synthetase n=1 Tax=Actinomadura viridis TaxID=58110 RepID=UPI0031E51FED